MNNYTMTIEAMGRMLRREQAEVERLKSELGRAADVIWNAASHLQCADGMKRVADECFAESKRIRGIK